MAGGRLEEGVSLDGSASDELVPAMEEIVSEDSTVEEEESAWLETPLSHATKNRRKQQVRFVFCMPMVSPSFYSSSSLTH